MSPMSNHRWEPPFTKYAVPSVLNCRLSNKLNRIKFFFQFVMFSLLVRKEKKEIANLKIMVIINNFKNTY